MASSYSRFDWYFSGLPTQEAAEKLLEDSLNSFYKGHDKNEWAVQSSVFNSQYGWKCGFYATREAVNG